MTGKEGKMSEMINAASKKKSDANAKVRWIARTGILSGIAIVLMYLEFPIPLMPAFLKFDFAEVVALLGAFAMGPWTGLLIELIKNVSHLPFTNTAMTGELANFLVCGSFVFLAGWIYQHNKSRKGAVISMIAGTLMMTIMGVIVNYYINLPFFMNVAGLNMDMIVGAVKASGNMLVHDMKSLLAFVFVPFNIFKGIVVSTIVFLMYKKVSPLLHD